MPTPEFNAAVLGFQRAQRLKPDGLMLPNGPTLRALNQQFPMPANSEAGALNPPAYGHAGPGRPITAPGLAEAQGVDGTPPPANDLFPVGGGRYAQAIVDNVDLLLAPEPQEIPAGTLDDFEAEALTLRNAEDRSRSRAVASMGVPGGTFRNQIHLAERSEWDEVRRGDTNAYGYYQLTEIALRDIGLMDEKNDWTGQWGITNTLQFLERPGAQEQAMTKYMANMERYLRGGHYDAFDYVGQEIVGIKAQEMAAMGDVAIAITISPVGLMAAAHRWGDGGVRSYIDHQIESDWVSNFEGLDKDTRDKHIAIETRLREFENVAYND